MTDFKTYFGKYIRIIAPTTLVALFIYLSTLGLVIECGDKVCDIEETCNLYCNVTNKGYQSFYLYNYDDWKIDFTPEIEEYSLYWFTRNKWVYTNFTMETRYGIRKDAKYIFIFPARVTRQFKIVVDAGQPLRFKFDFGDKNE